MILGQVWRPLEVIHTLLKKNDKYNDVYKILNIRRLDDISKKNEKKYREKTNNEKKMYFCRLKIMYNVK